MRTTLSWSSSRHAGVNGTSTEAYWSPLAAGNLGGTMSATRTSETRHGQARDIRLRVAS